MLSCAVCGKALQECCDLYYEAEDTTTGETVYLCGECAEKVEAEANAQNTLEADSANAQMRCNALEEAEA